MQVADTQVASRTAPRARILIVDDDTSHLHKLCSNFDHHGYQAVGFGDTTAALNALRGSKFDVLLTNLATPEIDGIVLMHAALQIEPNLAAIVMHGEGTILSAVEAMRAGALDYVAKPFRFSEIEQVLTRALAVSQLRKENSVLEQSRRAYALELESANKDLEAFGVAISHDLAAPLRAIAAFGELLSQRSRAELPPESQCYLDFIIKKIGNMQRLTSALLQFYQLGRQPISMRPVSVATLVESALEDFLYDPAYANVNVIVGDLPAGVGDPTLLQQVYANLLSNAYKFSSGKPHPQVEIGCETSSAGDVYFVRDNGSGFNTDHAGQLFVAFRRLHAQSDYPGTGVGLAMVRHIVERHGGKIWASSTIGEGSTFYFTLGNGAPSAVSPSLVQNADTRDDAAVERAIFREQQHPTARR